MKFNTATNPFAAPGVWLKGGVHIHTTRSDGKLEPDAVVEVYRQHGYDFLVFGDHWKITVPQAPEGMTIIPGAEFDARLDDDPAEFHFIAVAPQTVQVKAKDPYEMAGELLPRCAYLVAAHPYWSSMSTEQVLRLARLGVPAMEVYNHGCQVDNGLGYSMYAWDQVLSRGLRMNALAVDDAHFRSNDYCGGWVMLKAADRRPESIIAALQAGAFYSTTGAILLDVQFPQPDALQVRCSAAAEIMFRCNAYFGNVCCASDGQLLTDATWKLPDQSKRQDRHRTRLVRIEVTDPAGKKAWSNPFYLAE